LFATNVVYTGGKFAGCVVDTGGNLPPVSTTLDKLVEKFAAGVVDTGGKRIHEKTRSKKSRDTVPLSGLRLASETMLTFSSYTRSKIEPTKLATDYYLV
jgi:hypothetical protein